MKRNKYLDDLGIPHENQGVNYAPSKGDKRANHWKKERKKYGFDSRETWNLDGLMTQWIYCHLKHYKKCACVDLTYHKFDFDGTTYTEAEAIDYITERLGKYIQTEGWGDSVTQQEVSKAFALLGEILPTLWW